MLDCVKWSANDFSFLQPSSIGYPRPIVTLVHRSPSSICCPRPFVTFVYWSPSSIRYPRLLPLRPSSTVAAGATALIPSELFPAAADPKGAYVAPQVLVNVTGDMDVVKVGAFLYLLQGTLAGAVFAFVAVAIFAPVAVAVFALVAVAVFAPPSARLAWVR